jgi:hypothetical protein
MGNSTRSLESVYDMIAAQGIPDPRLNASGFGDTLGLTLANNVIADLITERFNWKWNRATAAPIYTNSWQQDYPQPKQPAGLIGWLEDCDLIDINNTTMPKPLWNLKVRRQISRTSTSTWRAQNICWMYNSELTLGTWPGADVVYVPLVGTAPQQQNPLMSMMDVNGNILIVTTPGTTGATAPELPAKSVEGTTVDDGSVVWTCVSPDSQGFRLDSLPNSAGPTYQIVPYFQMEPPNFADLAQLLNPIPNSFARHFDRGLESECLMASPNPNDRDRGNTAKINWLNSLLDAKKQGDKEVNIYELQPATCPVESRNGRYGAFTAERPY